MYDKDEKHKRGQKQTAHHIKAQSELSSRTNEESKNGHDSFRRCVNHNVALCRKGLKPENGDTQDQSEKKEQSISDTI